MRFYSKTATALIIQRIGVLIMFYVMQVKNRKATIYKKTKKISRVYKFLDELKNQGIKAYYIKKEVNT